MHLIYSSTVMLWWLFCSLTPWVTVFYEQVWCDGLPRYLWRCCCSGQKLARWHQRTSLETPLQENLLKQVLTPVRINEREIKPMMNFVFHLTPMMMMIFTIMRMTMVEMPHFVFCICQCTSGVFVFCILWRWHKWLLVRDPWCIIEYSVLASGLFCICILVYFIFWCILHFVVFCIL